jgi:hypothetical protein
MDKGVARDHDAKARERVSIRLIALFISTSVRSSFVDVLLLFLLGRGFPWL